MIFLKVCRNCQTENEDDALFCKKCGYSFIEEYENKEDADKQKKSKNKKVKQKKQKVKTKVKYKKPKQSKNHSETQKSGFFSKFLVFILLILVIALAFVVGVFGYRYYQESNIVVPDLVGYSYEEATAILDSAKLSYQQKEVLTDEEEEVGIVLKQSKKAGSKTHENAVITLSVGVLDTRVTVPDVVGMSLEEALQTLNELHISYQLVYEESDEEANTVLKQSIRGGKVIQNTESITLTISNQTTDTVTEDQENTSNQEEESSEEDTLDQSSDTIN